MAEHQDCHWSWTSPYIHVTSFLSSSTNSHHIHILFSSLRWHYWPKLSQKHILWIPSTWLTMVISTTKCHKIADISKNDITLLQQWWNQKTTKTITFCWGSISNTMDFPVHLQLIGYEDSLFGNTPPFYKKQVLSFFSISHLSRNRLMMNFIN